MTIICDVRAAKVPAYICWCTVGGGGGGGGVSVQHNTTSPSPPAPPYTSVDHWQAPG